MTTSPASGALPADIFDCEIVARPLPYPLDEYWQAPGSGPLHGAWENKPHRLVYDLVAAVKYYATLASPQVAPACEKCQGTGVQKLSVGGFMAHGSCQSCAAPAPVAPTPAQPSPSKTRPTKAQIEWLQAVATGKVTYSLNKHAFLGYPGNPRRSTYVMCNALRDGGWVQIAPNSADRFGHYAVTLTDAGRSVLGLSATLPTEPEGESGHG